MNPAHPAVLLVEDDASIARFVTLALEGMPLTLVSCASAEQAQSLLQSQPFALLITDLMLPGASGVELIEWLRNSPQAGCSAVVFSAGVRADVALRLEQLQVWGVLRKPVSVAQLVDCVESVLAAQPAGSPAPASVQAAGADMPADVPADGGPAAVSSYFGGDAALFHSYRASCLAQLPDDVALGENLLAARDAAALRRLAHNLKSVLRLLGHEQASGLAQTLEQACLASDWAGATDAWRQLGAALLGMLDGAGQRPRRG
ncbi:MULTISPECIES: response regulator [unclassified Delftia]|uniref:response regulator n=1 Tax=unclassified Delftia TaxID=2613839 RepID=UPI0018FF4CAA|nr:MULTISPECIES: response regulator [unclassified Delftia]MBK0111798.1 response regulator [Delftia sp. S65]MBK0117546.1 response regulator [Delftia sp. S67]MBK0130559.1 response regulator [Delftia sp. S66]